GQYLRAGQRWTPIAAGAASAAAVVKHSFTRRSPVARKSTASAEPAATVVIPAAPGIPAIALRCESGFLDRPTRVTTNDTLIIAWEFERGEFPKPVFVDT